LGFLRDAGVRLVICTVYALTGIFMLVYIQIMKAAFLSALSEPNRLQIVELLRDRPLSVNEIMLDLGLSQPQTSKHLKYLADSGVVLRHAVAQKRIYRLNPEPFQQFDEWLASFEHYWNATLDNLDDYLKKG
jgi:DNA-binding transcriptional ArsR family regulator